MTPRCFGLPSLIHRDAPHCAKCPYLDLCERKALAKAAALSRFIEVGDVITRLRNRGAIPEPAAVDGEVVPMSRTTAHERVRLPLTATDLALVARMPAKIRQKVELMMKRGQDVEAREALARGENPFPFNGAGYQHVACDLLLAGGFTRSDLRKAYIERLGWTEGTAYPHVSAIAAMFPALGLAKEVGKRFVRTT